MRSLAGSIAVIVLLPLGAACGGDEDEPACSPHPILESGPNLRLPRMAVGATLAVDLQDSTPKTATSSDEAVAIAAVVGDRVLVEARSPGAAHVVLNGACGATAALDVEAAAIARTELRPFLDGLDEVTEGLLPGNFEAEIPAALCPAGVSLRAGGTLLLRARPLDETGATLAGALDPAWTSSDPTVAVVPFGPVGDGLATVSWYEGHDPVTVSARGTSFDVAFSVTGAAAATLTPVQALDRVPIDRLELPIDRYDFMALLPYDAGGRLLLGPDPTPASAASRDGTIATVSAPLVLGSSGLAAFTIFAVDVGTTTVDFYVRNAPAALEVVVAAR